ncbi:MULTISPECIES: hypothetical protein [Streptococcus]|nr:MULTISPECIES: hypothetical protein [Streptococcus]MDQ8759681.1 hypothetical protein [Streptococcus ruminantium]MDQ8765118.1 hypothetical protein [Streptococcus ruminantium]MDQ8769164.1 hypothetical protein [Streptococcus ruminantium]MDQ8774555.1 hypothetical protein [Streptococcus ruminantium]MDQ8780238.1 hypothetical protein [Streptococcus ruminantium]
MCKALIKSDKVGMIFMIVELVYWLVMVGTVHTGYDVRLLVLGGVFLSDLLCSKNRSHYLNREKYEFGKLSYSKHKKMSYIVFSYLSVIVVNVLSVILIQTGLHFIILSGFITGMFLLFDNWTKKSILDSLRDELQFLIRTLYCLLFYVPVVHNLLVASCSVLKYGVLYLYVYLFSMLYHSFSLVSYMELSTCDKED